MLILTIKTDQALSKIALFSDSQLNDKIEWEAHRILADTIHLKMLELLKRNNYKWEDIGGLVCYKGPGSFTGLRIGLSVANTLAYSLECPIVSATGETWQTDGISKLLAGQDKKVALPFYGRDANITNPKK